MIKLPPPLLPLPAMLLRTRAAAAQGESAPPPVAARDTGEPDWRSAYQRLREQASTEPAPPLPPPPLWALPARAPGEPAPEVAAVRAAPASPTVDRLEAVRQLDPALPSATPLARAWQVELPAAGGTAWRLQVEQAQPLAPLHLELRVPPLAQTQARQQLGELDKRLREAGHDVLRSRLGEAARPGRRQRPVEGVEP